jgi:predicted kinase
VLARDVAAALEPAPGAVILRTDVIRKQMFGVDPLKALPQTAYTLEVNERVYRTMFTHGETILKQGLSVIFDAAFLAEDERKRLQDLASSCGAGFCGLFLDAPTNVRLQRISSRKRDASDAKHDVALLQEGFDIGKLDWPIVDASGSPQDTLTRAMALLCRLRKDTE